MLQAIAKELCPEEDKRKESLSTQTLNTSTLQED